MNLVKSRRLVVDFPAGVFTLGYERSLFKIATPQVTGKFKVKRD
ncbi:hypothetical protein [Dendronalium sp. ChiSLP03b]|nr:hypothetical protein [Dendronalium sp. ChiSLP03b]